MHKKYRVLSIANFIYIILIVTTFSCGPNKRALEGSSTYKDEEQMWNPEYRAYHISDELTRIYFIIPPGDILFIRNSETSKFEANAEISYLIIKPDNTTVSRGTVNIDRVENEIPKKAIIGFFDLKIANGSYYYSKMILDDKFTNHRYTNLLPIDKYNPFSKENFIMTDTTNRVLFMNYISSNSKIKISSERIKSSTYYVSKFNLIKKYPYPIYIEKEYSRPKYSIDTSFTIKADEYNTFEEEGIYHISEKENSSYGLTLFNFYDGFPQIAQKNNLAPPLRYITSDKEFNSLEIGTEQSKLKSELIWSSMSKNITKTEKQMISFYKRVQYSNLYFTSYTEGWRTDRGLVYLIYGPPTDIYKTPNDEKWIYGDSNSIIEYNFTFKRKINILTDNDYFLIRNSDKKRIWDTAIEAWRKGEVFDENEIIRLQEEADRRNNNMNNNWGPMYRQF